MLSQAFPAPSAAPAAALPANTPLVMEDKDERISYYGEQTAHASKRGRFQELDASLPENDESPDRSKQEISSTQAGMYIL